MKHQLSLELPSVNNPKILRIIDTSLYVEALPVECARLEITVPGFVSAVVVPVTRSFTLNLDSCLLELQQIGCSDETYSLPDGLYVIRYSVSPNDKVFVDFYHLRMTQTINTYYTKVGAFDHACCEPGRETKGKLQQFQLIRSFLDAAKGKVENRHEPTKGMELFLFAQRLLEKNHICQ